MAESTGIESAQQDLNLVDTPSKESTSHSYLSRFKLKQPKTISKIKNVIVVAKPIFSTSLSKAFSDLKLPPPDRIKTARELSLLSLESADTSSEAIQGYRAFYALDQLSAHYYQGYLRAGDHRIHVQIFQPLTQVQGTVWLLHGYLEHSGLYQPMIAELLAQSFAVLTMDLPGHGLSSGEETGISEFSVYQDMLNDIHIWVTQHAVAALPKPWVGIGQSTGCSIWMDHVLQMSARKHAPIVERLLLISPLIRPAKSGWWQNPIGLLLMSHIKHNIPRKFRRNNSNPDYLRFIRLQDPLQPRTMAMSWILALSRWMPYMDALPASRFPVWLIQGMRDQTVNWRYNNAFVRRKFRLKVALILEDASHQLVNECQEIRAPMTALMPVFLKEK
jgi:alpha-beta hydrolase superfamily lysophospholipase